MHRRTFALVMFALAALGCSETKAPAPAPASPAAAAQKAPTPAPAPVETKTEYGTYEHEFAVLDLATCERIHGKRPEGIRSGFPADTKRVWAWFEVRNTEKRSHVLVRWGRGDKRTRELRIHIGQNPNWHSWAPLDLGKDPDGWWTVEIASPQGRMMASRRFFVGDAGVQGGDDAPTK